MNNWIWLINDSRDKLLICDYYKKKWYKLIMLNWLKVSGFSTLVDSLNSSLNFWSRDGSVKSIEKAVIDYISKHWKLVIMIDAINKFLYSESQNDIIKLYSWLNEIRFESWKFNLVGFFEFKYLEVTTKRILYFEEYRNSVLSTDDFPIEYKKLVFDCDEVTTLDKFFSSFRNKLWLSLPNNRDWFNDVISDNIYFNLSPIVLIINDYEKLFEKEEDPIKHRCILESIINEMPSFSYPVYLIYN